MPSPSNSTFGEPRLFESFAGFFDLIKPIFEAVPLDRPNLCYEAVIDTNTEDVLAF